jgi:hypothetical protein
MSLPILTAKRIGSWGMPQPAVHSDENVAHGSWTRCRRLRKCVAAGPKPLLNESQEREEEASHTNSFRNASFSA